MISEAYVIRTHKLQLTKLRGYVEAAQSALTVACSCWCHGVGLCDGKTRE